MGSPIIIMNIYEWTEKFDHCCYLVAVVVTVTIVTFFGGVDSTLWIESERGKSRRYDVSSQKMYNSHPTPFPSCPFRLFFCRTVKETDEIPVILFIDMIN